MGRRLSDALFLDRLESGSFKIQSWDKATVDAHGMSLWISSIVGVPCHRVGGKVHCGWWNVINTSAWVSVRCSFLTGWANARAPSGGTGDR